MIHSDEKTRQMARSILPSTRRFTQTDKRLVKQRARAHLRDALVRVRHTVDAEGDEADDLHAWCDAEIRAVVSHRRGGDKTAGLLRWARARTAHLPRESRLSSLRAKLPRGVIGEHALEHLRWNDHFSAPMPWEVEGEKRLAPLHVRRKAWRDRESARLRDALRPLIESGWAHRELNRRLKAASAGLARPARVLRGLDDLTAFVEDVLDARDVGSHAYFLDGVGVPYGRWRDGAVYRANPNHAPQWARVCDEVVDAWEAGTLVAADPAAVRTPTRPARRRSSR